MVNFLYSAGKIHFKNVFIDGTKIEANANRYSFAWKKVILKNEAKMHVKIGKLIEEINHDYLQSFSFSDETAQEDLLSISSFMGKECKEQGIIFVYGSGHRPCVLQKQHDQIKEYLERQKNYDLTNEKFDGRNSYSKTDTDSTFMHMKEDHMMNGQLKPDYNLQIGVEAEYITGAGVFSDRNDLHTLKPMLENMEEKSGHKYENAIADSRYESEEGYVYLAEND